METLNLLCNLLDCDITDIIHYEEKAGQTGSCFFLSALR
ncbi:hypothetical protein [Lacrimispora sp. 210928-DFI.3.58]|nr:hypothetical protein [Lacrimispora sp. 210928-DFI.3.58]MCB7319799.1 hypothetical protein [Lacrimispora sp. 210928-DFI.3.58]